MKKNKTLYGRKYMTPVCMKQQVIVFVDMFCLLLKQYHRLLNIIREGGRSGIPLRSINEVLENIKSTNNQSITSHKLFLRGFVFVFLSSL